MSSAELSAATIGQSPTGADRTSVEQKQDEEGDDENENDSVDLSALNTWIDKDIVKHDNPLNPKKAFHQELTARDAFRSRLQTYLPLSYFCKPSSLSPIVCARFGWINTSLDMLQCVHCKAALAIIINPKLKKASSVKQLVKTYQNKLATAHISSCPFRFDAELYLLKTDSDKDANIIPIYLASVLPRDFWELVECPSPLGLMKSRFNTLCQHILKGEEPNGSAPPKWQLPDISLPDNVLGFGVVDPSNEIEEVDEGKQAPSPKRHSPSRKSRMLAKLAFDPSKPYSAIGWEKQTLLTTLEEILRPHSKEDEIRAQTRAQGAWEALYEGISALSLFGWLPRDEHSVTTATDSSGSVEASVSLHCPICLSVFDFELEEYDWHHHSHGRKATLGTKDDDEDGDQPPRKRRRLQVRVSTKLKPLLAHRSYCPYVCGFPRDGERTATPIWQTIAAKLLVQVRKPKAASHDMKHQNEDDDAATDRLLQLLQSSVSSYVHRQQQEY